MLQIGLNVAQLWSGNTTNWDTTLGIDHADATAIVGGLAAVVFAINVSVFAARIGRSGDLRGEMDLARWQRKMELLAPLAAVASLVVAGTRFPTETGLGIVLLAVASVTLAASDVRIRGRLGTLKIEAGVARLLHEETQGALDSFRDSMPDQLRARLPKELKPAESYLAGVFGLAFVLVVLKAVLTWLMLVNLPESEWQAIYYSDSGIEYLFWTHAWTLGALLALCQFSTLRIQRRSQLLAPYHGRVIPLHNIFVAEIITVAVIVGIEALISQPGLRAGQCWITFSLCFLLYASLWLGLGLGKSAVLGELARLTEAARDAELRAAAAAEELEAEMGLHNAFSITAQTPSPAGMEIQQVWSIMRRFFPKR